MLWLNDVDHHRKWKTAHILDVGAYVGRVATALAKKFPGSPIHAFEPVESSFRKLVSNIGPFPNITAHHAAMSDRPGRGFMVGKGQTSHLAAHGEEVPTLTVDWFWKTIGSPEIGLFKVDAEGHDMEILAGAEATLIVTDMVVVEATWNPRGAPHVDILELVRSMRNRGFDVIDSYSGNVGKFTRGAGYCDVLFARR